MAVDQSRRSSEKRCCRGQHRTEEPADKNKKKRKNAAISGGELRNSSVEPAFSFSDL
jgi:hypothetical protein